MLFQQTLGRFVDSGFTDQSRRYQIDDGFVDVESRQHFRTAVNRDGNPFRHGLVFQAPGTVVDDAGIRIHITLETKLTAQQISDDLL